MFSSSVFVELQKREKVRMKENTSRTPSFCHGIHSIHWLTIESIHFTAVSLSQRTHPGVLPWYSKNQIIFTSDVGLGRVFQYPSFIRNLASWIPILDPQIMKPGKPSCCESRTTLSDLISLCVMSYV
jgi:hypothetical protein